MTTPLEGLLRTYYALRGEDPETGPRPPCLLPLDEILGSRARVRVLRVLSTTRGPMWAGEIRRRSGLSRSGVWAALVRLEATGIVESVAAWGYARSAPVRIARRHVLEEDLRVLFAREWQVRRDRLVRPPEAL